MPIIYQHNINEHTKLAVWHITEPESFFLQRVPLKKEVSHPHKRLQHLAGRYLLPALFPGFPLDAIRVADTRRPFLEDEQYHFSISHCDDYAAAIVSTTQRVGVDIESITPRIERVRHKFVTAEEWNFLSSGFGSSGVRGAREQGQGHPGFEHRTLNFGTPELLTLLWSAKEVIFKWYGSGQLDFKTHMLLNGPLTTGEDGLMTMPFIFSRREQISLAVRALVIGQSVLSWTATAPDSPSGTMFSTI